MLTRRDLVSSGLPPSTHARLPHPSPPSTPQPSSLMSLLPLSCSDPQALNDFLHGSEKVSARGREGHSLAWRPEGRKGKPGSLRQWAFCEGLCIIFPVNRISQPPKRKNANYLNTFLTQKQCCIEYTCLIKISCYIKKKKCPGTGL